MNTRSTQVVFVIHVMFVITLRGQSIFTPAPDNTTTASVSEGASPGTFVYTVTGSSSLTSFSKLNQIPASPSFPFDSASGELTSPSGLDAEGIALFIFIFSGTDGSVNVTSGTLNVTISNINDNPPTFNESSSTTSILETVADGYNVIKLNATDRDVSHFIQFSITAGNTGSTFTIDSSTNYIKVQTASNLDAATTPSYILTVEVSDGTSSDTMTVTINVEADHCSPDPCQNSGACSNSGGTYVCACTVGYIGTTCTDVNPCWPEPCQNSGNCSINGSSYTCACPAGWLGQNCSTLDDPCHPHPCNFGTCAATGSTYQCACATGYSGVSCSVKETEEDSESQKNTTIVIIVVVTFIAVLGSFVVILFMKLSNSLCFKTSRKTDGTDYKRSESFSNSVAPMRTTKIDIPMSMR